MLDQTRYSDLLKQVHDWVVMPDGYDEEKYNKLLDLSLKRVLQSTANYLNVSIDDIPNELDYTIVAMCIQMIDSHEWLKAENDKANGVQSLSEGDTSVTFKSISDIYSSLQAANPITDNYIQELNNFRRLPQ